MNSFAAQTGIRRMSAADVEDAVALAASLKDAPHWPQAVYLGALNPASVPRRIALVAVNAASGSVMGFAVACLLLPQAELETIAVARERQRQGVGRRLWDAMARELERAGVRQARLEVRSSNLAALGLYQTLGFRETVRRPRYYTDPVEDAVLMDLRLG